MNSTILVISIGLLILLAGVVLAVVGLRTSRTTELDRRLRDFVTEPGSPQTRWGAQTIIYQPEISGSLMQRTVLPAFRRVGAFLGRLTPTQPIDELDRQLVQAGNPMGLHGREFYGIRILFIVLAVLLAFAIMRQQRGAMNILIALVAAVITFMIPRLWLRSRIRRRKDLLRRNLPDALDILSVCADVGLGFDQSMQRLSDSWKSPLGNEFGRVVLEMNMGMTRAEALRSMSQRLDVPEISSFVAVIIQSDELGMSIADVLHAQAGQMRLERRYWAQEQARKIPIRMLFPLILLILPAIWLVVLGPAVISLIEVLGQMR